MSRAQRHTLDCPQTLTSGASLNTEDFTSGNVQVTGIAASGATLRIEGTIDGTNYAPIILSGTGGSSNIAADGIYKLGAVDVESLFAYARIRAARTALGTLTPALTVTFMGRNSRVD